MNKYLCKIGILLSLFAFVGCASQTQEHDVTLDDASSGIMENEIIVESASRETMLFRNVEGAEVLVDAPAEWEVIESEVVPYNNYAIRNNALNSIVDITYSHSNNLSKEAFIEIISDTEDEELGVCEVATQESEQGDIVVVHFDYPEYQSVQVRLFNDKGVTILQAHAINPEEPNAVDSKALINLLEGITV